MRQREAAMRTRRSTQGCYLFIQLSFVLVLKRVRHALEIRSPKRLHLTKGISTSPQACTAAGMTAFAHRFSKDVTDLICEFVGRHPRARMREMASAVKRTEERQRGDPGRCLIAWTYTGKPLPMLFFDHGKCRAFRCWEHLDEQRVKYYGDFCESCD